MTTKAPAAVPRYTITVCTADGQILAECPLGQISDYIKDAGNLLWLDVRDPDEASTALLRREFGFHPLALEDALRRHQRPKVDEYAGYYFVVFYAARLTEGHTGIATEEVDIFIGPNYLVTLHAGEVAELVESRARWARNVREMARSTGVLLYSILDAIVDNYFPVVDAIGDRVDALEDAIFEDFDKDAMQEIFHLKRDLLALRRVVAPERDVMNILLRRDQPILDPSAHVYFQDVYDHIIRVADSIDTYRDLLSSALDSYLSVVSNRLNEIMKRLTAFSAILIVVALITGFFGMNLAFPGKDSSPELFWGVTAAIVVIAGGMFLGFWRAGYL